MATYRAVRLHGDGNPPEHLLIELCSLGIEATITRMLGEEAGHTIGHCVAPSAPPKPALAVRTVMLLVALMFPLSALAMLVMIAVDVCLPRRATP